MSINQMYHTWLVRMRQLRPAERITRLRNAAWIVAGIFQSGSVHLSRIAEKIPGLATTPSKARRLARFLSNPAIRVREWYEPIARTLLKHVADSGLEIRLIVDGTKIGFGHQLLLVAVAYRRRAIPIAWTWVNGSRGHSSSYKQLALLAYARRLMPKNAEVLVVGDSEFGAVEVLRHLDEWHWGYVLRQKANHLVKGKGQHTWQRFGDLVLQAGQSVWLVSARLTQEHAYPVNLLAYWKPGEKDPWLLATNLATSNATRHAYRRRMWLDETFGDLKKHGFDLEATHLHHFLRLSRLTLLAALLYLWLLSLGSQVIKRGQRPLVDRAERRDLSIFRIGFSMAQRYLTNAQPFSIRLRPYFT
jgi:hypothetical protein